MWKNVEAAPVDAIFGLTDAFKKDPNPAKVNLGVGVYKDEHGNTPVLQCVKEAERRLLENEVSKSYLPISGDGVYAAEVQKLLFGEDSEVIGRARAVTAHCPGGTGALRVGADLLKKFRPGAKIWISKPTWANHRGVFGGAGFGLEDYPYYNPVTRKVDFDGMVATLERIPPGDVVLLHACCHNPSGVDLTGEQWQQIARIGFDRGWLPFLDFAYQGFGNGLEEDRAAVDAFAEKGMDFMVASSFSKNFGLYNERTGALTLVAPTRQEAEIAMGHLKGTIRILYSNPPAHGGLVVATVLTDPDLRKLWIDELAAMRDRIKKMRGAFVEGIAARGVAQDFSYITEQLGMFSFSGFSEELVRWLKAEKSIYVVGGGRINVAGLTPANIDYVCDAVAEGLQR